MTDDERLARLTELARRVWPHEKVRVQLDANDGTASVVDLHLSEISEPDPVIDTLAHFTPQSASDGSRALDALEAALLVLLYPKQATWALEPNPLAWVEELAQEWTAKALEWQAEYRASGEPEDSANMVAAQQQLICAAKLLERAKG